MKVWVAHLYDGYGASKIEVFKEKLDAVIGGSKMLSKVCGEETKIRAVHNYCGNVEDVLIVVDHEADSFFPGGTEVLITQMEVK